jgi:hypothetical protein
VFLSRRVDDDAGPLRSNFTTTLKPLVNEVLKIYDR